jgi:hypothetical protein
VSAPVPDEHLHALRGAIAWLAADDGTPAPLLARLRALLASLEADDPREVGWMAASQALGYEARRESTKADVALWFWCAAAWLEQHKEGSRS